MQSVTTIDVSIDDKMLPFEGKNRNNIIGNEYNLSTS